MRAVRKIAMLGAVAGTVYFVSPAPVMAVDPCRQATIRAQQAGRDYNNYIKNVLCTRRVPGVKGEACSQNPAMQQRARQLEAAYGAAVRARTRACR